MKIAVIRCVGDSEKLKYRSMKERYRHNRYHSIGMRNTRYSPHGVRAMLNRIGERAYIDSVHPHRFRHTMATNLINSGMEIQDVSVILGHANINTTMRYVHMSDKNTEKNYRKYTENRKEKKQ